ncbi:MAG: translation elongation factor Ts [Deltaproteobacteria bacterium]|nr:translation elongation factor Ts [Deltaproteobacteria bacterium]
MTITAAMVKELRDKTGAGMMDCKKALSESNGQMQEAIDLLRQKGLATARQRASRAIKEGQVVAYIHAGGKLGVLVEINCETDFVARTPEYAEFAKNVAMHIAAAAPLALSREELAPELIEREKEIYRAQALDEGKPEQVIDRIVEGKLKKFFAETVLLEQPYVKETEMTVADYLNQTIAQTGEKMEIRRFTRFVLGEELENEG